MRVKPSRVDGILNYDVANDYPDRALLLINSSGIGVSCVNLLTKFLVGQGFQDKTFWKLRINDRGVRNDQLLRAVAKDQARFRGHSIQINYNANFEKDSFNHVSFNHTRLLEPDDTGYISKIAVYNNWDRSVSPKILSKDIQYIDVYNPDPAVIRAQVEKAGGWDKYNGQIFWHSEDGYLTYPLAMVDPVLEDLETAFACKIFKRTIVNKGFMAGHLFVHKGKFETEEARQEMIENLNQYQEPSAAGAILMVEVEQEEQIPELKAFTIQDYDGNFKQTEDSTRDNIIQAFNQPKVLLSVMEAGKLGTAREILDAQIYYNAFTKDDRQVLEETWMELFTRYKDTNINPTNNYSITPVEMVTKTDI